MAEEEKKWEVDRADGRPVGSKWERKRKSYEEGDNCRGRGGGAERTGEDVQGKSRVKRCAIGYLPDYTAVSDGGYGRGRKRSISYRST